MTHLFMKNSKRKNARTFKFFGSNFFFIECEIGYRTLRGKPCQPCSDGYYGRRCVESCKCKQNER